MSPLPPPLLLLTALLATPVAASPDPMATPAFPPVQDQATSTRSAKVLMIGIDGVRPDALLAADTPHLDLLARQGWITLEGRTTAITSSGPAWTSILTGARMGSHGVVDNSFEGSRLETWPSWLAQLEQHDPEAYTAAISQWSPIHEHITRGTVDFSMGTDSAKSVTQVAVQKLTEDGIDLTGMFLHYDDVDHAGHEFGYGPDIPEYLAALEQVDREIGEVLDGLRSREQLLFEDWLILVGTDHGGLGTSHGEDNPDCRTVFQVVSGVQASGLPWRELPEVVDFAGLALAHLGIETSTTPAPREDWWWRNRQQELNRRGAESGARIAFLGDSITQGWEGAGKEVWEQQYAPRKAVNLGIGGDRTQHVLWRLRNGNLKHQRPEVCVLMIGTNNSNEDTAPEIAKGIQAIVAELRFQLPEAEILLLAIFPRGVDAEDRLRKINAGANRQVEAWAAEQEKVHWLDINATMLTDEGVLPEEIMPDLLHPNTEGYRIWAEAMEPKLQELLGEG